jgi:hypothetical protein
MLIHQSLADNFAFTSAPTMHFSQISPKAPVALMNETLLHNDGCHHRVMDIAVVTIGSRLGERKAKAVSGREIARIESTLVSSDGMGDRILVHPGHLRARFHREGHWTEGKVHNRDAISVAGRRGGGRCRRCIRRDCRRCIRRRRRRSTRGCCCRGRTATTSSQEHDEASSQQAQPDLCSDKRTGFLHFSSSSAMLQDRHRREVSLSIRTYAIGLHAHLSCAGRTFDL